eukprot:3376682-Rhodomonas_salina.1
MWGRNLATSPHEARIRRQEAMREAGMTVPAQPIGSTSERVLNTGERVETDAQKKQRMLEGEALLCANARGEADRPVPIGVSWNDALFIVSPELILPDEWEALELETDSEQYEKGCLDAMDSSPDGIGWVAGPGYNNLPVTPSTVPTPTKEMKGSDLRTAWATNLWGSNPAVLYRALAKKIVLLLVTTQQGEARPPLLLDLTRGPRNTY